MDIKEIGWLGVDWIHLAHDRDKWRVSLNRVINLRVPQNSASFFFFLDNDVLACEISGAVYMRTSLSWIVTQ